MWPWKIHHSNIDDFPIESCFNRGHSFRCHLWSCLITRRALPNLDQPLRIFCCSILHWLRRAKRLGHWATGTSAEGSATPDRNTAGNGHRPSLGVKVVQMVQASAPMNSKASVGFFTNFTWRGGFAATWISQVVSYYRRVLEFPVHFVNSIISVNLRYQ